MAVITELVQFRCSEDDKRMLEEIARFMQRSQSDTLRVLLRDTHAALTEHNAGIEKRGFVSSDGRSAGKQQ